MKHRWFHAWGWVYRPVCWQGALLVLLGLAFSAQVTLAADSRSHSVSDTLCGVRSRASPHRLYIGRTLACRSRLGRGT